MRNFHKLAEGLDVKPLLHAVQRQPELWNQHNLRTKFPQSPHTQVDDIWLRFNDLKELRDSDDPTSVFHDHQNVWYPAIYKLPQARPFIYDLMRRVEGEQLGRIIITRLPPGKRIAAHIDGGDHASFYDRYHFTLQGLPGFQFRAGEETVCMQTGEAWWFDNSVEHELVNNSAEDRVTMIVDIRTFK